MQQKKQKVKDEETDIEGQKHADNEMGNQHVIVQPGDAEEHMKRAKQQQQKGQPYEFGEMNRALQGSNDVAFQYEQSRYQQPQQQYGQGQHPYQYEPHQQPPYGEGYGQHPHYSEPNQQQPYLQQPYSRQHHKKGHCRGNWKQFGPYQHPYSHHPHPHPYGHPPPFGHRPPYGGQHFGQPGFYPPPHHMYEQHPQNIEEKGQQKQETEKQKTTWEGRSDCKRRWRQKQQKGHCRGWKQGEGKRHGWKQGEGRGHCHRRRGEWSHFRGGRGQRCDESESSSDSDDENMNEMTKKHNDQLLVYYNSQMNEFFDQRKINETQRQKILKLLRNNFPTYNAPINDLISSVQQLQAFNMLFQMSYIKVIKVLIRFKFDLNCAGGKLMKIQERKIRRYEADLKFKEMYGNEEIEPMIELDALINKDHTNVLYVIDGNNILPTSKYFRGYFQSYDVYEKMEAQLRCRWFVSMALDKDKCIMFFDEKFNEEEMKTVETRLVPNAQQMDRIKGVQVVYGQGQIADNRIIEKVTELSKEETKRQVILVSSDRELYMRCRKIMKIEHTGGKSFFKCIRYFAKIKNKRDKQAKKILKTILHSNE